MAQPAFSEDLLLPLEKGRKSRQSASREGDTKEFSADDDINDWLLWVKIKRDEFTGEHVDDLRAKQPGSFEKMSLRLGSRTFRTFEAPDLAKIPQKDYLKPYVIIDNGSSSEVVAEASMFAYRMLLNLSLRFKDTGQYSESIKVFQRTVGSIDLEMDARAISPDAMLPRPVVSFIYTVPYAGHIETLVWSGKAQGHLYYVAKIVRKKFGKGIFVKFDWLAPGRAPTNHKYPVPRLQIGSPADLKGTSPRPKRKQWNGSRRSQRGRIRNASNGRFAANP